MSDSTMIIDINGNNVWRNSKGQLHREDGPAFENIEGSKYWYINGKSHRINGPAVELSNGTKEWWINHKCHRLNGPAIECRSGNNYWWVNGEWLGTNNEGFWALWDTLTDDQKKDHTLLSYLPM